MANMHICFLGEIATKHVSIGGIGTLIENLIPELIGQGCKVSAIGYRKQQAAIETELADGYTIYWINTMQWGMLRSIKKIMDTNRIIKQLHAKNKIDIIDSAEGGFFMVKKIKGIRFVVRLHGGHLFFANSTSDTPLKKKSLFIEKNSLKKADAVIGVSKYVWNITSAYYTWLQKLQHQIIHNLIVIENFYVSDFAKVEPYSILFFGSLTEKKGARQLVLAMPMVHEKIPNATLHIYGRDIPDRRSGKSFAATINETIESLHLKNVTIHPPVPNYQLPGIIEKAAIVVLPSHMEAMPLAWLEAMAMAKPFIGSNTGPGPEIIEHGTNGLLCNPFDPNDIAEKIIYLLTNQMEAISMGQQGREQVKNYYNAQKIATENIRFYKKIKSD